MTYHESFRSTEVALEPWSVRYLDRINHDKLSIYKYRIVFGEKSVRIIARRVGTLAINRLPMPMPLTQSMALPHLSAETALGPASTFVADAHEMNLLRARGFSEPA